jgi:hypothetical protein
VSVSKILSGHFSPKSPDCLPDGSGSLIRIEQETFGIKSQKEGGSGPPRAVTPWKKKKICFSKYVSTLCVKDVPRRNENYMEEFLHIIHRSEQSYTFYVLYVSFLRIARFWEPFFCSEKFVVHIEKNYVKKNGY